MTDPYRHYVGTVGWGYAPWKGVFYPPTLPTKAYLAHYSQFYDSVEIDSTFYGTPPVNRMVQWAAAVPDAFRFAVKTPRQISHDQQLNDVEPMLEFIEVARTLEHRLGPILIQLPPHFDFSERMRLQTFLSALPTDVRYAVEFRHSSWDQASDATADLLARHQICWVSADYVIMAKRIISTTDFLYLRFLGRHGRYETKDRELRDPTADLIHWERQLTQNRAESQTAFAYFNNDFAGYSPKTANRWKSRLGLDAKMPDIPIQRSLF